MVWQSNELQQLQRLFETNIDALSRPVNTINIDGMTFSLGDFNRQYAFITDPAVATDYLIAKWLSVFVPKGAPMWENWLHMWYKKDE